MSVRWQPALSICAAVILLAALAGCGGSSDPLHTVRSAAARTLSQTAQSTLTLNGARLFGGSPGTIVGRAEFSFPKGLGYQALQIPALDQQPSGTAYLVYLPTRLWVQPAVKTALPKGNLWISAPFGNSRSAGSLTPSLALVLEGLNPQLLLEEIVGGAVSASSSGGRVINHVPFNEYVVSVDLERALAATRTNGALRLAMRQELSALRVAQGAGKPLVRIVARVDGTGRLAQLETSLPGSRLGTVQFSLWKFGSTIPLSLPLASQTVELASLTRSYGPVQAPWVLTGE